MIVYSRPTTTLYTKNDPRTPNEQKRNTMLGLYHIDVAILTIRPYYVQQTREDARTMKSKIGRDKPKRIDPHRAITKNIRTMKR